MRWASDIRIVPVAAEDSYFRPDSWWHNREGQKTVFLRILENNRHLAGNVDEAFVSGALAIHV